MFTHTLISYRPTFSIVCCLSPSITQLDPESEIYLRVLLFFNQSPGFPTIFLWIGTSLVFGADKSWFHCQNYYRIVLHFRSSMILLSPVFLTDWLRTACQSISWFCYGTVVSYWLYYLPPLSSLVESGSDWMVTYFEFRLKWD